MESHYSRNVSLSLRILFIWISIHKLQKKMCIENNNSFFWQNDPGQATLITYSRQRLVLDFQVNRSLSFHVSWVQLIFLYRYTLPLPALSDTTDDNFRIIRNKINIESHILKHTLPDAWTRWTALKTENLSQSTTVCDVLIFGQLDKKCEIAIWHQTHKSTIV